MQFYIPGMPVENARQIAMAMQRPEGTIEAWSTYPGLLDPAKAGGILAQVTIGSIVFVLSRDQNLQLEFVHSSPGTGTRMASVDLTQLGEPPPDDRYFFALVWSPSEVRVHVGTSAGGALLVGYGERAPYSLQVAHDGSVVRLGDAGAQVAGTRMYSGHRQILGPTAIKLWEDTRLATETLLTGRSDVGYLFEVVLGNSALSSLVTGFETYTKERFLELEREGVSADLASLEKLVLVADREESSGEEGVRGGGTSRLSTLAGKINFQNYERVKRAYNRAFGIRFGELGLSSQVLEQLQVLIGYRHRIVHVSPILGLLNPSDSKGKPYFSNKETAAQALQIFDKFVTALHTATLALRPSPHSGPAGPREDHSPPLKG